MDITDILAKGREKLKQAKIDPREARLLLAFVLNVKSEELIKLKECSKEQYDKYNAVIQRRASGEPYAYIVGHREFMKLDFKVDKNVLIPREDTEILVLEAMDIAKEILKNKKEEIKILDMCTGSGCIAISLAKYLENTNVTAVDISSKALNIAKENAKKNKVTANWINSDLFDKIEDVYDIIVSNPPYIETEKIETLQDEVKREPKIALDGGKSGLVFYERIIKEAHKYLNVGGFLIMEIGFDQAKSVSKMMIDEGYENVYVKKDFSGMNRVIAGNILKQMK